MNRIPNHERHCVHFWIISNTMAAVITTFAASSNLALSLFSLDDEKTTAGISLIAGSSLIACSTSKPLTLGKLSGLV
jgi:hypothetical protein